ncbi:hypothetical protein Cme02nite_12230 [Catellatospora methionotrophica]|uniref:Uncharacterized protein n=1 Tax=Catellatospora methionotrophica TaxID=121620 RepID=A0A8J3LD59_9ACTN|nr:hypothetical protein Cme02nite_12230 [Catellatospora methionotrophica]
MPAMMHSAYARSGTGPSCQTAVDGDGMEARFTGQNTTVPDPQLHTPGRPIIFADHELAGGVTPVSS